MPKKPSPKRDQKASCDSAGKETLQLHSRESAVYRHFEQGHSHNALRFENRGYRYELDLVLGRHPVKRAPCFRSIVIRTLEGTTCMKEAVITFNRSDQATRDRRRCGEFIFLLAAKLKYDVLRELPVDQAGFLHSKEITRLNVDGRTRVPSSVYSTLGSLYRNENKGDREFLSRFLLDSDQLWHLIWFYGTTSSKAKDFDLVWLLNVTPDDIRCFDDSNRCIICNDVLRKLLARLFPQRCMLTPKAWETFYDRYEKTPHDGYSIARVKLRQAEQAADNRPRDAACSQLIHTPSRDWERLVVFCRQSLKSSVSQLSHKYDPNLYVARGHIEEEFRSFMRSPKNLFLILGESGVGKTCLMCYLAESCRNPAVFLSGDLYSVGAFSLGEELSRHFQTLWPESFSPADLADRVERLCRENKKQCLVFVDALNEFANPRAVLQELLSLVSRWGVAHPSIKFCVSCRMCSWEQLIEAARAGVPQWNLYLPMGSSPTTAIAGQGTSFSAYMGELEESEFGKAWELYQQRTRFEGKPSSEWQTLCRHPLFLRLVAQTYASRRIPDRIEGPELWDSYWSATVASGPKSTTELALEIVAKMRQRCVTALSEVEVHELPSYSDDRLGHLLSANIVFWSQSRYQQSLSFSHERVLEYALARWLLQANPFVETVGSHVNDIETFEHLEGAILLLAGMLNTSTLWGLMNSLMLRGKQGEGLVCGIIAELRLESADAWNLLEVLADKGEFGVARAIRAVGTSRPKRTITLLQRLLLRHQYHSLGLAISLADNLRRLCQQNQVFVEITERCLQHDWKCRQMAAMALAWLDGYAGWSNLGKIISRFSRSRNDSLRETAAFLINDLAHHDLREAKRVATCLSADPSEDVRRQVAQQLSRLGLPHEECLNLIKSMRRSRRRRVREVCAEIVGRALAHINSDEFVELGKSLAADEDRKIRRTFGKALAVCDPFVPEYESTILPMIETVVVNSSAEEVSEISGAFRKHHAIRADLVNRWHQSASVQVRRFVAQIWDSDSGDMAVDVAFELAEDPSVNVRIAFAERLSEWEAREVCDNIERISHVIEKLLDDKQGIVRSRACLAVCAFADQETDRPLSLLRRRLLDDNDGAVKCYAILSLVRIGGHEIPEIGDMILDVMSELGCWGELTILGFRLGALVEHNTSAFEYLCRVAQATSEACQHVAASSLGLVWLSKDAELLSQYIHVLEGTAESFPCRSHLMLYLWLTMEISESDLMPAVADSLPVFRGLLEAGFNNKSWYVRVWATWAAWQCLAYYPTALGDSAKSLLDKAAEDDDWHVRFACATYGGVLLLDKHRIVSGACADSIGRLSAILAGDGDQLVKDAASFSMSLISRGYTEARTGPETGGNASRKALTRLRKHALERLTELEADFYCRDFTWVSDGLAYEIEAFEQNRGDLLFAIWQRRPDETEALVAPWRTHRSEGLRRTARSFFRKMARNRGS